MEKVLSAVINQLEFLKARINRVEYITETYHEYKKEKDKFVKYLQKKIERDSKNRTEDSVHNKEQKRISKS